jgi:cytoskeletal protein CcmA (bactofilin family)
MTHYHSHFIIFGRRLLVVLWLCCWLLPPVAGAQEGDNAETLLVAADEVVRRDLATMGRDIEVRGTVDGDVTSWTGQIMIDGLVTGDVVSYGGTISLGPGAHVQGQVLALGDQVQRAAGARVSGQILGAQQEGMLPPAILGDPQQLGRGTGWLVTSALTLAALCLCVVFALIWPRRTAGISQALLAAPGRAFVVGLVSTLLLGSLAVFATTVLALTLIGVGLLLPFVLMLHLPYLLGLAGLSQIFGRRLGQQQAEHAVFFGALLILGALLAISLINGALGALLFYLLAGTGLGAVLISRGGALAPVQTRHSGPPQTG